MFVTSVRCLGLRSRCDVSYNVFMLQDRIVVTPLSVITKTRTIILCLCDGYWCVFSRLSITLCAIIMLGLFDCVTRSVNNTGCSGISCYY